MLNDFFVLYLSSFLDKDLSESFLLEAAVLLLVDSLAFELHLLSF
jgi:hypothetical protein